MVIMLWNPLSHLQFKSSVRNGNALPVRPRYRSSQHPIVGLNFRRSLFVLKSVSKSSSGSAVKTTRVLKNAEGLQKDSADLSLLDQRLTEDLSLLDQGLNEALIDDQEDARDALLERTVEEGEEADRRHGNWIMRILELSYLWKGKKKSGTEEPYITEEDISSEKDESTKLRSCRTVDCGCPCPYEESSSPALEHPRVVVNHDKNSFSKFLDHVSVGDLRFYFQMSHLSNLAYHIREIKPEYLFKAHGLKFIKSSLEKKDALASNVKTKESDDRKEVEDIESTPKRSGFSVKSKLHYVSPVTAYKVAATAASYLHSQTRNLLSIASRKESTKDSESLVVTDKPTQDASDEHNKKEAFSGSLTCCGGSHDLSDSEMASLFATSSVTAVVAAEEETKRAVADDLQSLHSSPCEWYICDDECTCTRYIVIQGSESMGSWQANLLFEPTQFEGFDVLVHRGIYEAAKGIYQQLLPEIQSYIKDHGPEARFRLAGHSLGGSLSVLLNLMLLIRGDVPPSSLLPVVSFGSPCIMCGGDYLLEKLGLGLNHIQSIVMHRDIVPRAFSCQYPGRVAALLKRLNNNFRNHPCLENQSILYAPMGQLLIVQPDEKVSPPHELLPSGSGMYTLGRLASSETFSQSPMSVLVRSAQLEFMNSPHPLEMLSDRTAYGVKGSICRDHDSRNYQKAITGVLRKELRELRKSDRSKRKQMWWTLVASGEYQSPYICSL